MRSALLPVPLVALTFAGVAWAGPPYLTDDPDPVPYHHWEVYTFYTRDRTRGTDTVNGPALEVNSGVAPNTHLHSIIPEIYFSQSRTGTHGLGDIELGVKHRFLIETRSRPEVGAFPQLELPTGDQSRGLGNGHIWVKVPLWLQKSSGAGASLGIQAAGTRPSAIWEAGGPYNFTPGFSLPPSAGHSFQGDGNSVAHLGLYRTIGPSSS